MHIISTNTFSVKLPRYFLLKAKAILFLSLTFLIVEESSAQDKTEDQAVSEPAGGSLNSWRGLSNNKSMTLSEVQAKFKAYWEGKKPRKGEGTKVYKRWENYMVPRTYPSGELYLPSTTYSKFSEWEKTTSRIRSGTEANAIASTANWTELNPNQKPSGFDSGVGRIDFVRFDPTNSQIMYVCSPDGGLWKSTNGGTSWTTNTDFLPIIGCADLAIDPTNTQVMYLATGNRESDRNSIGILKSIDGGANWNPTGVVFQPESYITMRRLIMDPTNPSIMIAATNSGLYKTTDGWNTFTVTQSGNFDDVEFKPGDPSVVFASGVKTYKSTNKGSTWTQITSGLPASGDIIRGLIAVTPADPNYVYTLFGNSTGGYLGTYRSTDGGDTFTAMSTFAGGTDNILNCDISTTKPDGQASHNLALAISVTNKDLIFIGGCNTWLSPDGGSTWELSSYWLGIDPAYPGVGSEASYVHADIQSLDFLPGSGSTLFATADGGIYKSTDLGSTWVDISNNLRVAQMTNVGQSSLTPLNMITGLQDIGTLKNTNGVWSVTNGGDGEDGFIDRTNDNVLITSNPNGAFALSLDGGVNRSDITGLPAGLEFFSPIAQDPVTANLVYAGGRPDLYKSTSVLSNPDAPWTKLGTPPGTNGITRFAIAPSNNQVIYVLKGDYVSKSTDGGVSFTDITGSLPVNAAYLSNVCVSNTDDKKVWITFSGYSAGNKVFRSVDGGTTWTNISAGLPNIPMNTIVYLNNSTKDAVYLGADIGVYYMDNDAAWIPFFTGLPRNHVNDLEIYYPTSKIRAATYGRGLWESDLFVPDITPSVVLSVSPNAGTASEADQTVVTFTVTASAPVTGNQTVTLDVDGTNITAGDFILSTTPSPAPAPETGIVKNARVGSTATPKANVKASAATANAVGNVILTIPDGQTEATGTFKVVDDTDVEATETAVLSISNPSAGIRLGSPASQNITIADNDVGCIKPSAGRDSTIACSGSTLPVSFDLINAQAGEAWQLLTQPAGASVSISSPDGIVTGTIAEGLYSFRLENSANAATCADTVNITVAPCPGPCVKPNAGPDQTLACIGGQLPSSIDLVDAQVGQSWAIITPLPAGANVSIASPSGTVTGTITAGVYNFRLEKINDAAACADTVQVTVSPCAIPCTNPDAGPDRTIACSGTLPTTFDLNDAKSGETWKIITPVPAGANISINTAGTVTGTIVPGVYTFSLQSIADPTGCADIIEVTVEACPTPCVKPDAGVDVTVCLPNTSMDLKDAPAGLVWSQGATNPAGANVDPTSGTVTGLNLGTYQFVLTRTSQAACSDTVMIMVESKKAAQTICKGSVGTITVTADPGITNVVWFNSANTQVGTGSTLIITASTPGLDDTIDNTEAFYYTGKDGLGNDVTLYCWEQVIIVDCCQCGDD